MLQKFPKPFFVFLIVVFALNLVQSYFTSLLYDEAYYWYYAQNLDWGYFDHPPMVAVLIALSSLFFDGEPGVRFMSCILSAGTYSILWLLVDHPEKKKYVVPFFLIVFSFTLLNAYGFLMLPDTPLLFFTALFLLLYKRFLKNPTVPITLGLGVVMAALMYSKYHAVLVILSVLLSNITLIKNKKAWLAVTVALVCYIPHITWLYHNDFVSVQYHLFERPNQAYSFKKFTLSYFLNLIAIIGLLFYWTYKALFRYKATDKFAKALLYLTYGIMVFFFISSFNRRVQAQWLIVISIPLAIMAFTYFLENPKSRKWMYGISLLSLLALLYTRAWLIYQPLFPLYFETHGSTKWVKELREKAGDLPVVFENSYRRAPMYEFYSGNPTFSLNTYRYRKNQYTIDPSEERVRHKKVVYVTSYENGDDITYTQSDGSVFHGVFIDHFESYRKLKCIVEKESTKASFTLKVYNPYPFAIPSDALQYWIAYTNAYKQVKELLPLRVTPVTQYKALLKAKDTVFYHFQLPLPKNMEMPKYFRIGIAGHGLPPGLNSNPIKLPE